MGYIGFMYIHHYTAFIKILKFLKFTIDVRVTCLIYQPDLFLMDGISHPVIYDKVFLGRGGGGRIVFMPPKELWEAYSNRTVRPSVRQSVRPSVRPAFVSGPYLLYSLR